MFLYLNLWMKKFESRDETNCFMEEASFVFSDVPLDSLKNGEILFTVKSNDF